MSVKVFCKHCGKANPKTNEVCSDCGEPLEKGAAGGKTPADPGPAPEKIKRGTSIFRDALEKTEPAADTGPSHVKCPQCGRVNRGTNRFCNGCGSKLEGAEAAEPPEKEGVLPPATEGPPPPDPAVALPNLPDWMSQDPSASSKAETAPAESPPEPAPPAPHPPPPEPEPGTPAPETPAAPQPAPPKNPPPIEEKESSSPAPPPSPETGTPDDRPHREEAVFCEQCGTLNAGFQNCVDCGTPLDGNP